MDLRDYPRPKGDTGIGVHWSAGYPAVVGIGQIRDFWLPELQAMGVKWVKLAQYDGGLELAELLLKNDIMPIVRLYRFQPNPGTLDEKTLLRSKTTWRPACAISSSTTNPTCRSSGRATSCRRMLSRVVARNAIIDMEAILAAGGYPAIPALTVGSKWDLVGEICRQGRRDLFAEPVWQAIHNYSHQPSARLSVRCRQSIRRALYAGLLRSAGGRTVGGQRVERLEPGARERRAARPRQPRGHSVRRSLVLAGVRTLRQADPGPDRPLPADPGDGKRLHRR